MELKHTPGPWAYERQPNGDDIIGDSRGVVVAYLSAHTNEDGALMAAAPDMLELLIADLSQRTGGDPVDYCRAVAGPRERETLRKHLIVIAKARGKSTFGNDWMEALS